MQELLQQVIERYEHESHPISSFICNYKDRPVEELDTILAEFLPLYAWQDSTGDRGDLIPPDDWFTFSHWEPCDQTDFLAYLTIKIAVARS
jgi:hypothetical protein